MRSELRSAMAKHMTEDELLQGILEGALLMGWRVHHARRSDRAIVQGTQGLPDLVLARRGRVLFLELKDAKGQLTLDQLAWLQAIDPAGSPWQLDHLQVLEARGLYRAAFLIRPTDYDAVLELLA